MKYIFGSTVFITLIILGSCSNSLESEIRGEWNISSVTFDKTDSTTSVKLAALVWMNLLSNDSRIRFTKRNEIFVNNQLKGIFRIINDKIVIYDTQNVNSEGRIFYSPKKDQLELVFKNKTKILLSKTQ